MGKGYEAKPAKGEAQRWGVLEETRGKLPRALAPWNHTGLATSCVDTRAPHPVTRLLLGSGHAGPFWLACSRIPDTPAPAPKESGCGGNAHCLHRLLGSSQLLFSARVVGALPPPESQVPPSPASRPVQGQRSQATYANAFYTTCVLPRDSYALSSLRLWSRG